MLEHSYVQPFPHYLWLPCATKNVTCDQVSNIHDLPLLIDVLTIPDLGELISKLT